MSLDQQIRIAAFSWLAEQVKQHGDVLPRTLLVQGFTFQGNRIPLVSPQGIFKPKQLDLPLSITTTPEGPYDDGLEGDLLHYKYRGTDPNHRDNVGLRRLMEQNTPLVYFHGIIPGKYLAVWPVFIVGDDPASLTFNVAADEIHVVDQPAYMVEEERSTRRRYITSNVKVRLHQRGFRERVLAAYRSQCSFCKLKHAGLLDAAHIVPDGNPMGTPTVNNGLALCKIHHAAFDQYMIAVTPDYEIRIREDILGEKDGPMLLHGLQELHQQKIILPKMKKAWPDRDNLDWRYQQFSNM